MNRYSIGIIILLVLAGALSFGCNKGPSSARGDILASYPLDSLEGLKTRNDILFDESDSADGKGSIRIIARSPRVVRLFETGDIDVEDARIIYRAKVKTNGFRGRAYLEMWVRLPGKGEYYSRSLQSPIAGTMDWVSIETPFFLKKGQNPENVKLNLVMNGTGDVWMDDIELEKGPLK